MSAREHVRRLFDAMPDDCQRAVLDADIRAVGNGSYSILFGDLYGEYLQLVVTKGGGVLVSSPEGDWPFTHIDRLLQPAHPNSLASRIAAATASQNGQGGSFIDGEASHGR